MWATVQKNRWEEEFPRTDKEITELQCLPRHPSAIGQMAYCEEMIFRWQELSQVADQQYRIVNPRFPVTWAPLVTI